MNTFDVLIIGGGIAGLAAATLFSRAGFSVAVLEKEEYPRHKVCGEYISRESLSFLENLGIQNLSSLPQIDQFLLTTAGGAQLRAKLPLGGFGWSRYAFDAALAEGAKSAGAQLFTRTKVESVTATENGFEVRTAAGDFRGKLVLGSWGKKSNLDVQMQRSFLRKEDPVLDGWVGIKHHIHYDGHAADTVALHQFPGGYCGISFVEEGRLCLCYLVKESALRDAGNSIPKLEETVLSRNHTLHKIWAEAQFLFPKPLAISGISFQKRTAIEDGVLCLGDAAGMIPPLSGNGMSMALHSAKIAFEAALPFLEGKGSRATLEASFTRNWMGHFRRRLWMGRVLQGRFGSEALLRPAIGLLNTVPLLKTAVIRSTHGKVF